MPIEKGEKTMKKISILIIIAIMITVGSVYAAWSYAQGTTASSEITREINMAQVNTDSNKGTISVTPSNFAFLVDDVGTIDYVAELTGTGHLTINFTPAAGADASLATNGIQMIATITVVKSGSTTGTYTGIDSTGAPVTVVPLKAKEGQNVVAITGNGIGGTTQLTAAQILSALEFNESKSVKLPTKSDNDNFHNILKDYTIKITISEVVA